MTNYIDDAVSAVMDARQSAIMSEISMAVAAARLDSTRQQGQAVVSLIEGVARMPREPGKGNLFDTHG